MHKCDAYILVCDRLLFGSQMLQLWIPLLSLCFAFSFAAYDEPYLLALLADCIEIRTVEPCLFIQSVPLPKPKLVFRCHQGLVYVASLDYVWCLQAVPLTQQIHVLLEDKQFQLALKLTVRIMDQDEIVCNIWNALQKLRLEGKCLARKLIHFNTIVNNGSVCFVYVLLFI
jgi:hypothetical protein